jgi:hypothetical protein
LANILCKQGDQIGRFGDCLLSAVFRYFFHRERIALILIKKDLGYALGDFSQYHLVTLPEGKLCCVTAFIREKSVTAKTIKVVKNCQLQTQPVVILFRRQI